MATSRTRTRWGALTLAVAGVLFILYPAVRPWQDESTVQGAIKAMSSGTWVAAHLFAMVGFILVALGLLAVWNAVSATRAERLGFAAVVTGWIGVGLTLPYYGAEDFGLNAIARKAAEGQRFDLLALIDTVRFSPVPATTFTLGLLLLGAGAVVAAIAVWRSGVLPRSSGILFALGFAVFLLQFFTPPAVRIAHGLLVAAGSAWLALALWQAKAAQAPESVPYQGADEALTRENIGSWHTLRPHTQSIHAVRADQASSCAYRLRSSGTREVPHDDDSSSRPGAAWWKLPLRPNRGSARCTSPLPHQRRSSRSRTVGGCRTGPPGGFSANRSARRACVGCSACRSPC
jgi:hypothetical protein